MKIFHLIIIIFGLLLLNNLGAQNPPSMFDQNGRMKLPSQYDKDYNQYSSAQRGVPPPEILDQIETQVRKWFTMNQNGQKQQACNEAIPKLQNWQNQYPGLNLKGTISTFQNECSSQNSMTNTTSNNQLYNSQQQLTNLLQREIQAANQKNAQLISEVNSISVPSLPVESNLDVNSIQDKLDVESQTISLDNFRMEDYDNDFNTAKTELNLTVNLLSNSNELNEEKSREFVFPGKLTSNEPDNPKKIEFPEYFVSPLNLNSPVITTVQSTSGTLVINNANAVNRMVENNFDYDKILNDDGSSLEQSIDKDLKKFNPLAHLSETLLDVPSYEEKPKSGGFGEYLINNDTLFYGLAATLAVAGSPVTAVFFAGAWYFSK